MFQRQKIISHELGRFRSTCHRTRNIVGWNLNALPQLHLIFIWVVAAKRLVVFPSKNMFVSALTSINHILEAHICDATLIDK